MLDVPQRDAARNPRTVTTATAEKPFDFASTPGKLPKNVVPEEYAIRIIPDLEKKTFTGSETIKITARETVKQFVLNAAEIKITKATLDAKTVPTAAIKLDEKEETLAFQLPTADLKPGEHTVVVRAEDAARNVGAGKGVFRWKAPAASREHDEQGR